MQVPVSLPPTTNPVSDERIRENVRHSVALGLPTLLGANDAKDGLFSIVGSGPSTAQNLDKIRERPRIVAAGSAYKFLIANGIVPHFAVAIDPLPAMADVYSKSDPETHFLIASQCDPSVFAALAGRKVTVWHASVGVDLSDVVPKPHGLYGGGNNVVLRAWALGFAAGYRNFEFFGFDCCLMSGERHVLEQFNSLAAQDETGMIVNAGGREFFTTHGLLAMALSYREQAQRYGHLYKVAVHGDGLAAWMTHRQEKQT